MSEYQHQSNCPHCSGGINYNDEHTGHATPCPHCSKSVILSAGRGTGSGWNWNLIIGVGLFLGLIVNVGKFTGLIGGERSKDTHTEQPAKNGVAPSFPPPRPIAAEPVSKPMPAISKTPSDEPAKPDTNRVAAMAKLANDYNQSISAINQLYPAINALESQLRTQRSFLTQENIVTIQFEINKANIVLSSEIKKVRVFATALEELNCKTIPNQPSTPPFQFIGKVE